MQLRSSLHQDSIVAMATITDVQYFIFFLLLWLISTLLLRYIFKKPTGHLRLLPSPPALPVVGHIHHLTPALYKCFHNLSSKYGPLIYLRLGSYPLIVVSSASMATEIFKSHDLNFSSRPHSVLGDSILFGNSGFFTAAYGDYWRFMKKLCVTELLGPRQLERSRRVRREELVQFLHKVLEKAHNNEVVDVGAQIMTLTNNTTCRMVMSTRCSGEENEAEMIRELVKESNKLTGKMSLTLLLGPLRKLGFWVCRKQFLNVNKAYDELFEKLLKEHEERAKKKGAETEREDKDLMDILLEVYQDNNAQFKISRKMMKAFFLDLFLGGTTTSADTMQWVMAELINHPCVFKKLREEIESVVGRNRIVEESDIPSLHYLQAVVKETLRLYPPLPSIPRVCRENCKIGEFDIPKGTPVVVNTYSVMRDPQLWDNPDEFWPERFLVSPEGRDNQTETKGQNFGFVPFGGGRRMCPGANLAFCVINSAVAAMVQCFDWKIGGEGGGTKVDTQIKSGLALPMAYPLLCLPVVHFNPFAP